MTILKVPETFVGAKPLLKKLLLQMDNYVKHNKNRHLLLFLSLLIANEVFQEVHLGFLVVGHMHKDLKFWLFVKNIERTK